MGGDYFALSLVARGAGRDQSVAITSLEGRGGPGCGTDYRFGTRASSDLPDLTSGHALAGFMHRAGSGIGREAAPPRHVSKVTSGSSTAPKQFITNFAHRHHHIAGHRHARFTGTTERCGCQEEISTITSLPSGFTEFTVEPVYNKVGFRNASDATH